MDKEMNANELAEGILAIEERIFLTKKEHQLFQNSATMLRQQQEKIKDLKQQVAFLEDWRDTWSPFLKATTGKVNEK